MFVGQYGRNGRPDVTAAEDIAIFITGKVDVKVGPVPQYRGQLGPIVGTVFKYRLHNCTQHFFTDKI